MPQRPLVIFLIPTLLITLALVQACAPALAVRAVRSLSPEAEEIQADLFNNGAVDLDIRFATGKADILPESQPLLDDAAAALADIDREKYVLHVVGHTDSTGDAALNMSLSQKRAQAVVAYFQAKYAMPWWFLTPIGKGETELKVNPEKTDADRAVNRRVELVLVEKDVK